IADYSIPSENETDLSSDSDDGIEDEEENTFEDESDDDDSIQDDEDLSNNVLNVSGMTYQGMRVFDYIQPQLGKIIFCSQYQRHEKVSAQTNSHMATFK
ncbi:unnamed protein product, partial [Rotaria magnacalcarata]